MALESALAVALCSLAPVLVARASSLQSSPEVAAVRARVESGDLAGALSECESIPDLAVRAEWKFHVLEKGGDLPGALAAASAGLAADPRSPALLVNATYCALALSEGELAERLGARLAEIEAEPQEPWSGFRAKAQELRGRAVLLADLERRGARGLARARIASGLGLAGALLSLIALAWRNRRAEQRST